MNVYIAFVRHEEDFIPDVIGVYSEEQLARLALLVRGYVEDEPPNGDFWLGESNAWIEPHVVHDYDTMQLSGDVTQAASRRSAADTD